MAMLLPYGNLIFKNIIFDTTQFGQSQWQVMSNQHATVTETEDSRLSQTLIVNC